jgi:MtN3 and saliva related transmembrane protein
MIEILGYAAATLTTASFLPQTIRTLKTKETKAISLTMYSVFCTGVLLWLVYGLIIQNWPLVLANAVTFLLAGLIWFLKFRAVVFKSE